MNGYSQSEYISEFGLLYEEYMKERAKIEELEEKYDKVYGSRNESFNGNEYNTIVSGPGQDERSVEYRNAILEVQRETIAHQYYFMEIKEAAQMYIDGRIKELNKIIYNKNVELARYVNNPYNSERDAILTEIRKMEEAIAELEEAREAVEFNELDISLKHRGMSPFESKYYDEMDKIDLSKFRLGRSYPASPMNYGKEKLEEETNTLVDPSEDAEKTQDSSDLGEEEKTGDNIEVEQDEEEKTDDDIEIEQDEEPVKVTKVTAWQWVKDHKKQILIALGLTALAISIVVLVTQFLPALMAAQKATTVSGLLNQMYANGVAWFSASPAEQAALHAANHGLASQITNLTGAARHFAEATGVWTFNGVTLNNAMVPAAAAAAKAVKTAAILKTVVLGTGLGGLGTLGAGLLMGKRSEEYKRIISMINNLVNNSELMNEEEFKRNMGNIQFDIETAKNLLPGEREILYKKLKSAIHKAVKGIKIDERVDTASEVEQTQEPDEMANAADEAELDLGDEESSMKL